VCQVVSDFDQIDSNWHHEKALNLSFRMVPILLKSDTI